VDIESYDPAMLESNIVVIPQGSFLMGATSRDPLAEGGEYPQREVWLSSYAIQRTPVTIAQWKVFLAETNYDWSVDRSGRGPDGWPITEATWDIWNQVQRVCSGGNYPVVCVSWFDCVAYSKWLSNKIGMKFSLPTEAQWEKACRGVDGRRFIWGDEEDQLWSYLDEDELHYVTRQPVAEHPERSSPFGCYDMWQNVCEWCSDWYDFSYYEYSPRVNPLGPMSGECRALRGGNPAMSHAGLCFNRRYWWPEARVTIHGFRLVAQL